MEIRRQNDIIAFKYRDKQPIGFHSRNLEVAEISEELWDAIIFQPSSRALNEQAPDEDVQQALSEWNAHDNPSVSSGRLGFGIRSLTLNVTQICNLKCTYCAAGGDGTYGAPQAKISIEKTLPQLKFFIERVPTNEKFKIVFLGGEPLLYPEAIKAISHYVRHESLDRKIIPEFSIVTNGTLLNQQNLEILKEIKCRITISIDGPAKINDLQRPFKNGGKSDDIENIRGADSGRGSKGSTEAVVNGLNRILAEKQEYGPVVLHGVFDKNNLDLVAAYDFYSQFPVDNYEFTFSVQNSHKPAANLNKKYSFDSSEETHSDQFNFAENKLVNEIKEEKSNDSKNHHNFDDNKDQQNNDLSDEIANEIFCQQMFEIGRRAFSEKGEMGLRKIGFYDNIFYALDNQQRTENFCGAGKSFLAIDARNNIFACPWQVGSKDLQIGQFTTLNQNSLDALPKSQIEQNNCQSCWARYLCGGGCTYIHNQELSRHQQQVALNKVAEDVHHKEANIQQQDPTSHQIKSKDFCFRMRNLLLGALYFYKQSRLS